MIVIVSLVLYLFFFILAFIAGFVLRALTGHRSMEIVTIYAQGMTVILLIFCVCSEFCAFSGASIKFAGALWLAAIFTLEIFFLFMDAGRFPRFFKSFRAGLRNRKKESALTLIFAAVVILIIILQMIFLIRYAPEGPDVLGRLSDATFSGETGQVVHGSPLMMLYAWLSDLIRVHPMTLVYTVLPPLMLSMYYSIEWSLARKLFADDTDKCLFMLFIFELLHIFGFQSAIFTKTTLLLSYFSEEAFLVHGVLATALWFVLDRVEKRQPVKEKAAEAQQIARGPSGTETEESFEEEWDMNHRIVNSRNVGIALIVLAVCFAGMILVLNRKINNLHEAAAGLQENIQQSLRAYEFIPEGSGKAEGLVLVQSNGALLVTGGGSDAYGDELYEFITKYGNRVDCWYLTGEGEESTGAYKVCKKRGLDIGSVYLMNLKEYKGKK